MSASERVYRAGVVADGGVVTGVVGADVAVLPDMSPKRTLDFLASQAAVAEVGGQLAHLAIVGREQRKTLMVLPDACSLLKPGMVVTLDPSRCEVRVTAEREPRE